VDVAVVNGLPVGVIELPAGCDYAVMTRGGQRMLLLAAGDLHGGGVELLGAAAGGVDDDPQPRGAQDRPATIEIGTRPERT
jgi:hypothetical protein